MIDKIIQTKNHSYEMLGKKDNINIKTFGDLHYFKKFDDRKLELISGNLSAEELEYLCLAGDIIDSTDFLKTHKEKSEKLYNFFEVLPKE